jgi:hypothetical protein
MRFAASLSAVLCTVACGHAPPAGVCADPQPGTLPTGTESGSGYVTGPELTAALCNLYVTPAADPSGWPFLDIQVADGEGGSESAQFDTPSGGSLMGLNGSFRLLSNPAGVEYSSQPNHCGKMTLIYTAPVFPGTDCSAATAPDCPAGCVVVPCAVASCTACTPATIQTTYVADTCSNIGAWSLDLSWTDATETTPDKVHGALTVDLVQSDDPSQVARLQVNF